MGTTDITWHRHINQPPLWPISLNKNLSVTMRDRYKKRPCLNTWHWEDVRTRERVKANVWNKLYYKGLSTLHSSSNMSGVIKSREMRWTLYVVHTLLVISNQSTWASIVITFCWTNFYIGVGLRYKVYFRSWLTRQQQTNVIQCKTFTVDKLHFLPSCILVFFLHPSFLASLNLGCHSIFIYFYLSLSIPVSDSSSTLFYTSTLPSGFLAFLRVNSRQRGEHNDQ